MGTHTIKSLRYFSVGLATLLALSSCGYNSLQGLDEQVKGAWAEVQNQYQRRADLIPNLVATVKGASQFEQETLQKVIEARAQATSIKLDAQVLNDPATFKKFEDVQRNLSGALSRLLVVAERYPDLKATANFRDLQVQLEGTENRISVERMRFNEAAQAYNTKRLSFPANLIANAFGFGEKAYFKSQAGAATAPQVKF